MDSREVIDQMFERIVNKGELTLIDELFAPEFVSHVTGRANMDREGFREFVRSWRTAFPDVHCEVSQFLSEGDRASWTITATGTHKAEFNGIPATGRKVDFLSMNDAIFREARLVSCHRNSCV